ncbi:ABC transporter substrate-binding protein [Candidatus Pantoea bituminis]|uniref:ABC transporter substrate-binding protein n=1 Tax=Candidatus Pantoea bituminis TaxID=2831036 RepID=UPI001C062C91|nr:ABC transporter substrate-binding protein [Pantoea bituminis]
MTSFNKKNLVTAIITISSVTFILSTHAATPADTLVVAKNLEDVISLDPAEAYENTTGEIINNSYSRLVHRDKHDATKIVGDVAQSWDVSSDGKTYTFTLNPAEKFPSGRAIAAEDVVYSLQRVILLNKTPAFLLRNFGWNKDNVNSNVQAIKGKVIIHIQDAIAPQLVLQILATSVTSVVDEKLLQQHSKDNDYGNGWLRTAWAGSGPFSIQTWQPKQAIVLEKNSAYYGEQAKISRVIFRHVPDSSTQTLLLTKGDVDLAYNLQPDQLADLIKDKQFKTVDSLKLTQIYIPLNQKVEPLKSDKVREALKYLIDYQGIKNNLLKGQWVIHQSFYGIGQPGVLTDNPYHLDVAKAKQLLDEAGYKQGFELKMDVENTSPYPDIAQSIQSTFALAGVRLKLVTSDRRQIVTEYRDRKHQTILWHASVDYNDPNASAADYAYNTDNSLHSTNRNRAWRSSWIDHNINKLTDLALHEKDPQKRLSDYQTLQRDMWKVSPYIFLFQQKERLAINGHVQDLVTGPNYDATLYNYVVKR